MELTKLTRLLKPTGIVSLQISRYSVSGDSFYAALLDNLIPSFKYYTEKREIISNFREKLVEKVTIDILRPLGNKELQDYYQNHTLKQDATNIFNVRQQVSPHQLQLKKRQQIQEPGVTHPNTQLEWVKNVILADGISPSKYEIEVIANILANFGTEIFGQLIVTFRIPIHRIPDNLNLIIVGTRSSFTQSEHLQDSTPTFCEPYLSLLDRIPISLIGYDGDKFYGVKYTDISNITQGIWDRNLPSTKKLVKIYQRATNSEQIHLYNLNENRDDIVTIQYNSQGNQVGFVPLFSEETTYDETISNEDEIISNEDETVDDQTITEKTIDEELDQISELEQMSELQRQEARQILQLAAQQVQLYQSNSDQPNKRQYQGQLDEQNLLGQQKQTYSLDKSYVEHHLLNKLIKAFASWDPANYDLILTSEDDILRLNPGVPIGDMESIIEERKELIKFAEEIIESVTGSADAREETAAIILLVKQANIS